MEGRESKLGETWSKGGRDGGKRESNGCEGKEGEKWRGGKEIWSK